MPPEISRYPQTLKCTNRNKSLEFFRKLAIFTGMKTKTSTTNRQTSAVIYPQKVMTRISDEMHANLTRVSDATHIHASEIVRAAIEAAIEAHDRYGMLSFPLKVIPPRAFEQAAKAAKAVEEELSAYYLKETKNK